MSKQTSGAGANSSAATIRSITVERMIRMIREGHKNRERFCFVLGAGASRTSDIPTGQTMAFRWMKEIMESEDILDFQLQASELYEEEQIKHTFDQLREAYEAALASDEADEDKTMPSKYYFDVYTLRFAPHMRNGYRALEDSMVGKMPNIGYLPLARLLADKSNGSNVVVTTNFDSLAEDALTLFAETKPLVINHEELAPFVGDPTVSRPIIAQIHRGVFFAPLNQPDEMDGLKGEWNNVLRQIFGLYTPIVIGYGSGDHSLMDFLMRDDVYLHNGIYWCYYAPAESVESLSPEIREIVKKKKGHFVKTQGFDATLWSIGDSLGYTMDPDQVADAWKKQQKSRLEIFEAQRKKIKPDTSVTDAPSPIPPVPPTTPSGKAPRTAWEFSRQGDAFRKNQEYDAAIEAYTRAIEKNNRIASFYYWRAVSYCGLNKFEETIADYTKAIELEPDDKYAYNNRGHAYNELQQYEAAIADCTQAIALDPKYAVAYNNRGFAYDNLKQYKEAIDDYTKAIALDPKYAIAYNNRGSAYDDLKQYEEAIADYTQAIALDPKDATAYNNRGFAYDNLKQYEEAIADYTKAIALDPKYASAYNNRGSAYDDLKQYEEAIADYTQAIALDPKDATAYNNRGFAYDNLKQYEEAIADYTQAIALDPKYAVAYNNRGSAYYGMKQYKEAIDDYTQAIVLNPKCIEAYENRAIIYRATNQIALAEADEAMAKKLKEEQGS